MADHIQIGDISPRIQYAGDAAQTAFTYPFPIFAELDIQAYVDGVLNTLGVDYTVAGAGASAGGTVTFAVAPANGTVVTLRRSMALARTSDFQESGEFRAKVINDELDILTALLQQVDEQSDRSLRLGPTDSATTTLIPDKASRAGKFLGFDTGGDPIASAGSVDTLAVSTFIATLLGDVDAAAARTTLGALAPTGDGSNLTGIATGATDAQKANIALNAFRIAVNGGVSVQNMADGVVDEFTDETGVDTVTSTNETYDATNDYYHNNAAIAQIAQATGTAIGNMTNGGALAAAFDSNEDQAQGATAQGSNGTLGTIGKDYGAGFEKVIKQVTVISSTDQGFMSTANSSITIDVYGTTDGTATGGTLIGTTGAFTDGSVKTTKVIDCSANTTAWRSFYTAISAVASNTPLMAEVKAYEPGTPPDMTLLGTAFTALAQPGNAFLVLWHETVDAVTLNTDLKAWASRDGGATWTQATLTLAASLSGNEQILTGSVDISAQPAGTSMKWKIETLTHKEQRLRGVSQQWS